MKRKISRLIIMIVTLCLALSFASCSLGGNDEGKKDENTFNIVSSFYPMHILCMNLVKDIDGVNETCMSEPNMGCIHDHTFTTEDLKKIENADVFVENGKGLEAFNDQIERAYPNTSIVQASDTITDTCEGGSCSDDEDVNAHFWTSIDNYILQVKCVSSKLQEVNAVNKDKYIANENTYVTKLNNLKTEYANRLSALSGKKALVLDETLPWFCKFLGIDYISIETDHEGEGLSANELSTVTQQMNTDNIKAIFIVKDTDKANANSISEGTGATIYEFNNCMVGTVEEDAYIKDMRENFNTALTILND